MQHCLSGRSHGGSRRIRLASVEVALPAREAATCHIQPDAMARQEGISGSPQINRDNVGGAWFHGTGGRLEAVPVAHACNAIGQWNGAPVGIDIHQARDKIGVGRVGRDMQRDGDWPCYLKRALQRTGGVDKCVRAALDWGLINWASAVEAMQQRRAADSRCRIGRVIGIAVGWLSLWSERAEGAVTRGGIGAAAAVEIPALLSEALWRPLSGGLPDIGAHEEVFHRWLTVKWGGLLAFEPAIEELEVQGHQINLVIHQRAR